MAHDPALLEYIKSYKAFREAVSESVWASHQSNGLKAGGRRHWSSVLMVRICALSLSTLKLCPDLAKWDGEHWDYASVASLTRSLFESVLFFRYFTQPVGDDEWIAKLNIMQLNDCMHRLKMFTQYDKPDTVKFFTDEAEKLRSKIASNPFFLTLEEKQRKSLLSGSRPSIPNLRQMAGSLGFSSAIWGLYELMSSHTHTLPLSFYRSSDQGRTGVPNKTDAGYIAEAMRLGKALLDDVVSFYKQDFSDLVTFRPLPKDFDPFSLAAGEGLPKDVADEPYRNAPCPCGSGKKYKHCHGR